jgi:hypothetical protein
MEILLVDGIKDVVLHNGLVRVDCVSAGPNGTQRESGTLLIPANVVGPIVQTLANALAELDKQLREQRDAQVAARPSA